MATIRAQLGAQVVTAEIVINRPPSGGLAPTDWGYRPPVPAGYTLVENQAVGTLQSNRYYRNCVMGPKFVSGSLNLNHSIFVDCDFYGPGTSGGWGAFLEYYGCRFGGDTAQSDTDNADCLHIRPDTSGGARPHDYIIQGCSFLDALQGNTQSHTDGIQFGGSYNMTVRWCRFENIAVEHILMNNFNGVLNNMVVDRCYFGSRPNPGGPPIHVNWTTGGAISNNYFDGAVASYANSSGIATTNTRPRSEWTHGDPWQTY